MISENMERFIVCTCWHAKNKIPLSEILSDEKKVLEIKEDIETFNDWTHSKLINTKIVEHNYCLCWSESCGTYRNSKTLYGEVIDKKLLCEEKTSDSLCREYIITMKLKEGLLIFYDEDLWNGIQHYYIYYDKNGEHLIKKLYSAFKEKLKEIDRKNLNKSINRGREYLLKKLNLINEVELDRMIDKLTKKKYNIVGNNYNEKGVMYMLKGNKIMIFAKKGEYWDGYSNMSGEKYEIKIKKENKIILKTKLDIYEYEEWDSVGWSRRLELFKKTGVSGDTIAEDIFNYIKNYYFP